MTSRMFATAAAQANLVVRVGRPCAPTAAFSGSAAALRRQEQRPTPQQQQRQRSEQRQAAAAAGQAPRRRRLRQVAAAVAAPAATGPAASAEWGADVLAAVDAVRLASRLCQVRLRPCMPWGPARVHALLRLPVFRGDQDAGRAPAASRLRCWMAGATSPHLAAARRAHRLALCAAPPDARRRCRCS